MESQERLLGKLEEFQEWVKKDLTEIKAEIKSLNSFKWRMAGGAAVLSIIAIMLVEVIHFIK